jgi:hypothetical protein
VWTGELMLVWGGSAGGELNTGGGYSVRDGDADGAGDAYDCAPADAGSYAQPQEVANLTETGAGTTSLTWQGQESLAGAGVLYDVVTGSIADLSSGVGFSGSTCLAAGLTSPASTDENSPGASDGFYYLVRARNVCGSGTYGPGRGALDAASPCP